MVRPKKFSLRLTFRDNIMLASGALAAFAIFGVGLFIVHHHLPLRPESATITSPWVPASVKHWQTPIDAMAKKYNIDPNLVAIIMTMESGGYAQANSGSAEGLMQITPDTAKTIASRFLKKPTNSYNLWDPNTNIEFGVAYLAHLRNVFGDSSQSPSWVTVELIAAGYNGGPGSADRLEKGEGLTNTQAVVYSRDAFNMWRERHANDSPTFDRWKERGGTTLLDKASGANQ